MKFLWTSAALGFLSFSSYAYGLTPQEMMANAATFKADTRAASNDLTDSVAEAAQEYFIIETLGVYAPCEHHMNDAYQSLDSADVAQAAATQQANLVEDLYFEIVNHFLYGEDEEAEADYDDIVAEEESTGEIISDGENDLEEFWNHIADYEECVDGTV